MNILIGCEESQIICNAFRNARYNAYSNDLKPTRGNPLYHFQEDVFISIKRRYWDLIILHPDCTALALSGNRWYGKGMIYHDKREKAINWTLSLWNEAKKYSNCVALENPASVIFKYLPRVQYIQPWQFGHGEQKKTGFALHNLPRLISTDIVSGREERIWKMPPGPNRKRDRSVTYVGIANAIVDQWGAHIKNQLKGFTNVTPII